MSGLDILANAASSYESLIQVKTPDDVSDQEKSVIHTIIDLINSVIEANLQKEKNYLYEIISTRFFIKLKHTFDDKQLMKRIDDNINKKINYDESSKKFSFITKKINYIALQNDVIFENNINKKYCEVTIKKLSRIEYRKNINKSK